MKHNYEVDELICEMNLLKKTFDVVRLIDVSQQKQCDLTCGSENIRCLAYKCDFMCTKAEARHWHMLLKTAQNKTTHTQLEISGEDLYYTVVKYIQVGGTDFVLELISKKGKQEAEFPEVQVTGQRRSSVEKRNVKVSKKISRKREVAERVQTELNNLERSISEEEFYLLYQPKIENVSGRVVGAEALIRWKQNAVQNSSESFIIQLEKNNLIYLIDYYVLQSVIEQMKKWEELGEWIMPISVNMCCSTLLRSDFFEKVIQLTSSYSFCNKIEIEITERNIPLDQIKELIIVTERLKMLGFQIALDDFGAYSANFPLAFELNLNTLKVDKSMIKGVEENIKIQKILKEIFLTCKAFDIRVIVEGVEKKAQLDQLMMLGSEFSQGYYFSKPTNLELIKKAY